MNTVETVRYPDPHGSSYASLLRDAHRSGRCPFWIGAHGTRLLTGEDGPEPPGEVRAAIDRADPAAALDDWWPGPCPMRCGCRDPFPDGFPGLWVPDRPVTRRRAVDAAVEAATGLGPLCTMGVADASRPADLPAVIGWGGPGNYPHQELSDLSAVLRSWEDRFGAVLVLLAESTMYLSVAEPPRTDRESERVGAEHFAFCPDQMDPQDGTEWDLWRYARSIQGVRHWRFWWDRPEQRITGAG